MNDNLKEKYLKDSISEFGIEGIEKILFQMRFCICRIYKNEITGSGFFAKIPIKNKSKFLPVLITNNHVLNEEEIGVGKTIKLTINNDKVIRYIKIDDSRKKMTNEKLDFTIIEIKPNDDNINSFLDIDENVNNKELFQLKSQNQSLYILHYPESYNIKISFGLLNKIMDNDIIHKCTTHEGSSGSPILSLDTFKVIGIHYEKTKFEANKGIFIKSAIDEFNQKFKNINEYIINEFQEKTTIISEDYNEKNDLKENFHIKKENNEIDNKVYNEEDKIELFNDDFIEKYKNNCFLIINGKKQKLRKFLYIKEFESIKHIEDNMLYYKNNNYYYYINHYLSLLYYPDSFVFTNIDSNIVENNKFKLDKEKKLEYIAYSLCYLKNHKLIAIGMEKKIVLYDLLFNIKSSNNSLDGKVSYIYELSDGKMILTDLSQTIKILKIDNNKIIIDKIIKTKEEENFVGIELTNKKLIFGGYTYLSIIGSFLWNGYQLDKSLYSGSFISNIVELNSNLFLIGKSYDSKLIIFSSETIEEIYTLSNIYLHSNNYSISKISEEYVGIAGEEKSICTGCIYIFSIKLLKILKKFYINDVLRCYVILKVNDNEFITVGKNSEYFDLISLNIKETNNKIVINNNFNYTKLSNQVTEALILI